MTISQAELFVCTNCDASYKVVRVESVDGDRDIFCRCCGASLRGRDGAMILKYFLVGRRNDKWRRERLPAASLIPDRVAYVS